MARKVQGDTFYIERGSVYNEYLSATDEDINKKYNRGEIRIVTEQARYPLDNIKGMLDSKKYNLSPEYQRRKRWDKSRKSRLIESFIMNVPIPPIFLYEVEYSEYEVMDGQQRLNAIYDFYNGSYALEGLEYWKELEGKTYNDLPEQIKRGIDRRYLSSIVLLQETAKSKAEAEYLKQIVFERLNSGGEKLNPHETRNALYSGAFNELCIKLSMNDNFRKMWGFPLYSEGDESLLQSDEYRQMIDVAFVLRFFAYRHIEKMQGGVTLEDFLDQYLKQANKYDFLTIKELQSIFEDTVDFIYEILGNNAFIPPQDIQKKTNLKKPARAVYDPIMQAFCTFLDRKEDVILNKEKFSNLYDRVRQDMAISTGKYLFEGRFNNKADVEARIKYYVNFINDVLR